MKRAMDMTWEEVERLTPEEQMQARIKEEQEERIENEREFRKIYPNEYRNHKRHELLHPTFYLAKRKKRVQLKALSVISHKRLLEFWKGLTTLPMPEIRGYLLSDKQFNTFHDNAIRSPGNTANSIKEWGYDAPTEEVQGFVTPVEKMQHITYLICIRLKCQLNVTNQEGKVVSLSGDLSFLAHDITLEHELNHVLEHEVKKNA
jgi:hypothetical protein